MSRKVNERGQVIVFTVVALLVLVGMSSMVLDVGGWWRTKRRLQGTADAAALAGAQMLPKDPVAARAMALDYANRNGGDVAAADITVTSKFAPNDVISVKAQKTQDGVFSRLLGIDSAEIHASAKARVGVPEAVRYVAPMVVSCAHDYIKNCNNNGRTPDFGPAYSTALNFDKMGAPGAFGMLNLDKDKGTPGTSDEAAWILRGFSGELYPGFYRSDPGAKFSSNEIRSALDQRLLPDADPLLFPVFEKDESLKTGGGQITEYKIIGWIAFKLTAYDNVSGNNIVLSGYFTDYIASGILSPGGSGGPDFGLRTIQLID